MIAASFVVFLLVFLVIGVASAARSRSTDNDYLLAGREMKPWLVAMSAAATANSGYMFIGQIGYTYLIGLSSIWVMIGWLGGDLLASLFIHRRLRDVSGERDLLSFGEILSGWYGTNFKWLRLMAGVVTLVLLGTYAAAQFKAGSKALHVLFGWDYSVGAVIGCVIVVAYCLAGGIRASIWTDAAQSVVMLVAMSLLLFTAVQTAGGVADFSHGLSGVSADYMSLFPSEVRDRGVFGPPLFVFGWICMGIGVVGQPHIMVRFMTLDSSRRIGRVRWYYYTWSTVFFLFAIGVGMAARLLLPHPESFDPETALPLLAMDHLPAILVGLILAGLFAATMSTADSQILSCSAALTRDVLPGRNWSLRVTKIATLTAAAIALAIALRGSANVFNLVVIAWSTLAAGFAPLIIVYAVGRRASQAVAIAMLVGGVAVTLLWRESGLSATVYEVAPGMLAGLGIYALAQGLGWNVVPTRKRSSIR